MQKKRKNYYPHAIIISIFLIIGACIWTIIVALDNPVEMDDFYFEKYQQVDRNINDILKKQKEFFAEYNVTYKSKNIKQNIPQDIVFGIYEKASKKLVKDANVSLLITRPDTNKLNQKFNITKAREDGFYVLKNLVVKKPGRWQAKSKIKIGKHEGFFEYELNATN